MATSPEVYLANIITCIDKIKLKIYTRKSELDFSILLENYMIPILNPIFETDLDNANRRVNASPAPGIDLIDHAKKIGFQVTRENSSKKVSETLAKVAKHYSNKITEVYIILLVDKQQKYSLPTQEDIENASKFNFSPGIHIMDLNDLAAKVKFLIHKPKELIKLHETLTFLTSGMENINLNLNDSELELHRFIHNRFLDVRYFNETFGEQLIHYYSNLFKLITTLEGPIEKNTKNEVNIFNQCLNHIVKSQSENPLVVTGYSGSGKTTFLSVLYKYLLSSLPALNDKLIPIYINLHDYIYEKDEVTALQNLSDDVAKLNQIIPYGKELVLILDGHEDSFQFIIQKANIYIGNIIKKFRVKKKIIGIKINDRPFEGHPSGQGVEFANEAESKINIQPISRFDPNYSHIIELYSKITANDLQDSHKQNNIFQFLLERIDVFKISRIDFFLLHILVQKQHLPAYSQCQTLSSFLSKYCTENRQKESNNLEKLSNQTFEIYIRKQSKNEILSDNWRFINTNQTIRDYLLAYQIIHRLISIGKPNTEKIPKTENDRFNFVYTDSINNFCKEILNESTITQTFVYEGIVKVFNKSHITARTHFSYLLGRLTNAGLKQNAKNFLKTTLQGLNMGQTKDSPNQYLLFQRTIYISLIYLGDFQSNQDYIKKIITDRKWDSINRGFHREYYGDIPFDPGHLNLTHEDNLEEGLTNTFNKLYRKLKEAVDKNSTYNLFEVELYTICSLAQHRQASNNSSVEEEQLELLGKLTKEIIAKEIIKTTALARYIEVVSKAFAEGKQFKKGTYLLDLYQIKERPRSGWIERGFENTETVSSHIYGAYIIGKVCLPQNLPDYPTYNKTKILDLVLIHDLAEAITGDIAKRNKTNEHKEIESLTMEKIAMIGTYFDNELINIDREWKSFESNQSDDINVLIARDLDKLDNLAQLLVYKHHRNLESSDFLNWKQGLINAIKTEIGQTITKWITQCFPG